MSTPLAASDPSVTRLSSASVVSSLVSLVQVTAKLETAIEDGQGALTGASSKVSAAEMSIEECNKVDEKLFEEMIAFESARRRDVMLKALEPLKKERAKVYIDAIDRVSNFPVRSKPISIDDIPLNSDDQRKLDDIERRADDMCQNIRSTRGTGFDAELAAKFGPQIARNGARETKYEEQLNAAHAKQKRVRNKLAALNNNLAKVATKRDDIILQLVIGWDNNRRVGGPVDSRSGKGEIVGRAKERAVAEE